MVLNIIGAIGAGFVLLYVVATVIRLSGYGGLVTLVAQTGATAVTGYALLSISFVGLPTAVALTLLPLGVQVFAYVWFYHQGKKVLRGDYGEQARWAAELVEEGDDEFIEASARLSQIELREIGIVSDDKEELRENTVERVEELESE